jgi:hypothetical protein
MMLRTRLSTRWPVSGCDAMYSSTDAIRVLAIVSPVVLDCAGFKIDAGIAVRRRLSG